MGVVRMRLCLNEFKKELQNGFLRPNNYSFGYIDEAKFNQFKIQQNWKESNIKDTFYELRQRMSSKYFSDVVLAQTCALNYAALQFPAYSMLIVEDLTDDWLATVDFHKKFSRDHSLHQPLTAYVAASLLGFGNSKESLSIPVGNLLDFCVNTIFSKDAEYLFEMARRFGFSDKVLENTPLAKEFWKDLFYRTVILSALFHDMGYPWQYVDRIGADLRNRVPLLHPSDSVVSSIVDNFQERMVFLPLRNYQTSPANVSVYDKQFLLEQTRAAMETHGFPGAIAFLSLNDAIRKKPVADPAAKIQEFAIEWAAMGIFMHDMEKKHKKLFPKLRVSFAQDPLSAIIALADYLEEFNRPKVSFVSKSRESRVKYYSDCSDIEINIDSKGILNINMKYNKEASKAIAAVFKTEETEDYFNPTNGYVDLSPLGVKKVVYLQS